MFSSPPILISLTSFGASEVRRHGQLWFTRLADEAGADGVEVRSELLMEPQAELPELAAAVRGLELDVVYSSPDGLWAAGGRLDRAAVARTFDAANVLGAKRVKMSIGAFSADGAADIAELARLARDASVELLIENDQTETAGTRAALCRFFAAADSAGVALPMTFDIGNWHWSGECPVQMAARFADRVHYVHCKGVERRDRRWVAVPLTESAAPWRTVLQALPASVPWAIEFPLVGDDLLAVTRMQIGLLRAAARHQQGVPA